VEVSLARFCYFLKIKVKLEVVRKKCFLLEVYSRKRLIVFHPIDGRSPSPTAYRED
jgi:hypothetical protein